MSNSLSLMCKRFQHFVRNAAIQREVWITISTNSFWNVIFLLMIAGKDDRNDDGKTDAGYLFLIAEPNSISLESNFLEQPHFSVSAILHPQ